MKILGYGLQDFQKTPYLERGPMQNDGFTHSDSSTNGHSFPDGDIGTQLQGKAKGETPVSLTWQARVPP